MGTSQIDRKLAAILAADVEGYSRLMQSDEVATLRTLIACREVTDRLIAQHRGRIFNTAGDSVLAEFASAVDAVECAVAVQRAIEVHNAGSPPERQMRFRIGVHVGDVLVESNNLFGDGVNIAARLESIAPAGGICVSRAARDQIRDKLALVIEDIGEQAVKNTDRPVRAFRIMPDGVATTGSPATPRTLPGKPSIAVLPFTNMSGDAEQEYFADGMAEEIITGLSRLRWLFVLARNSTFTYKGRAIDVTQVGRDLGVRYVLEGSVRRAAGRVRFTAQLIDAATNAHIWADRFDGHLGDIFALQDKITEKIVSTIEPEIRAAEMERARRKRPDNLGAYDLYLRSLSLSDQFTKEAIAATLDLCTRAIASDPSFAPAYALAGRCYIQKLVQGWLAAEEKEAGLQLIANGLMADRNDASMLAVAAHTYAFLAHDFATALPLLDEAVSLNPNVSWGSFTAESFGIFMATRRRRFNTCNARSTSARETCEVTTSSRALRSRTSYKVAMKRPTPMRDGRFN